MTTPIGPKIRKSFETMRYPMIDLLFIGIGLVIRFADAFGDHTPSALLVAGVFAVRTLHASRVLDKVSTQGAAHDVVELLRDELMTLLLEHLFFLLADCSLSIESNVEGPTVFHLLGCKAISLRTRKANNRQITHQNS